MTKPDDAAAVEASAYPLIAYIHVPKTAGTTVRTILPICSPFGRDGVEFVDGNRASFVGVVRKWDWVAGHVARDVLANRLIWFDRPVEYFSTVREPVVQLLSHLNFSFERFTRPNYHNSFSVTEQRLDVEVMATDFSNPAAVATLLFRHAEPFLNNQSHYVLGGDFAELSDDEIARRLASYTYVASEDDLPKLYRAFGFAQLPEGVDEVRKNVTKHYYVRPEIFESPQLREFLARHHKHDLRLYAAVRRASWPAEGRRPFRPAFLARQAFTSENFDEQTYLESNPDVAAAVESGQLASGRVHFVELGYKENRMIRRWVLPPAAVSQPKSTNEHLSAPTVIERLRELREAHAQLAAQLQSRRQAPPERTLRSAIADLQ